MALPVPSATGRPPFSQVSACLASKAFISRDLRRFQHSPLADGLCVCALIESTGRHTLRVRQVGRLFTCVYFGVIMIAELSLPSCEELR